MKTRWTILILVALFFGVGLWSEGKPLNGAIAVIAIVGMGITKELMMKMERPKK